MVVTVTAVSALGLSAVISIIAVVSLMVFLASRELAGTSRSLLAARIVKFATVGILPLSMAFVTIVAMKIIEVL